MRTRHQDLAIAALVAVGCAAVALIVDVTLLRTAAAGVLFVLLPGFVLTEAAFARRDLEPLHRLLVGLVVGLAVLALGAVVLNITPVGITRTTWTLLVLGVVLTGCHTASRRRWTSPLPPRPPRIGRLARPQVALLAIAGASVVTGVALSRTPLPAPNVVGYTQFWMLPAGTSQRPEITIGVRSAEVTERTFRVELRVGGDTRVVRQRLTLAPGEVFEERVRLRRFPRLARDRDEGPAPPPPSQVTALLYRLDGPGNVYRRVSAEIR